MFVSMQVLLLMSYKNCIRIFVYVLLFYRLNTTFTAREESVFRNLADIVKWVDSPVQYRNSLTTDDVRFRVKDFEKSLEVRNSSCLINAFI